MSKRYNVSGLASNLELGKGGSRWKISGTDIQARNSADSAYVNVSGLDATSAEHFVTKNQLDAVTGGSVMQPGIILENTQFHIDFNNQTSYPPNQTTTWTDLVGGASGTCTNTSNTDGHLNFNGSTSEVNFGAPSSALATAFAGGGTVYAWIRVESDGGGNLGRVIDTGVAATLRNYTLLVSNESGGNVAIGFYHAFTGTAGWWRTSVTIPLNTWVFVAVTYNSDSTANLPTFYVDGAAVAIGATVSSPFGTANTGTVDPVLVGQRPVSGGAAFDGDIEIVGVCDATHAATAVLDSYNATKSRFGHGGGADTNIYDNDGTLSGARSVAFSTFDMTFSGTGNFIVNNTAKFLQNTPSVGQVPVSTGTDGSWTWQTNTAVGVPQAGTNGDGLVFSVDFMDPSSLPIDQIASVTELVSGTTGTISNCTYEDGWLTFSHGSNSIVDMGAPSTDVQNVWDSGGSAAWWMQIDSLLFSLSPWVIDGGWGTGSNNGYVFWLSDVSGSTARLNLSWHCGSLTRWYVTVNIGSWFHVAVSWSAAATTTAPVVYIDGSSVSVTAVTTGGTYVKQTGDTNIGNRPALDREIDGKVGPYQLWNRTLSSTEVGKVYALTKPRYQSTDATWSTVLAAGNTSGGTDPVLSVGDTFRGPDAAASFLGTPFNIRGANSSTSWGQQVVIQGGVSTAFGNSGGGVAILAGQGTNSGGTGASVTITAAGGNTGGANSAGGSVNITAGDGFGASAIGGSINLTCGDSPTGTTGAGNIVGTAGSNVGTLLASLGGYVAFTGGTSHGTTGGFYAYSGDSIATANSNNQIGPIVIQTGTMAGSATTWSGGAITITSQGDTSGGTNAVTGADINITAGNTGLVNADAGKVKITTGYTYGFNAAQGGHVILKLGKEVNGSSVGALGGSLQVTPGSSGSNEDGGLHVFPVDDTFLESAVKFTAEGEGSAAVPSGGSTVTLGTISHNMSTNERVQIFDIQVTGTLSTGGEFRALSWSVMVSRTGGTLTVTNMGGASTATINSTYGMGSGGTFGADIQFQVNTSGNAVVLQALSGGGAYTGHFAWNVRRQLGGASS